MKRTARTPLLLAAFLAWVSSAHAGQDWVPPRPVTVVAPNVTLLPGVPRTLDLMIRTHGSPANLRWTAIPGGASEFNFAPILGSTTGTLSLAANQSAAIPITVTVPATAPSPSTGTITFRVTYEPGTGRASPDIFTIVRAATGGRPELFPLPTVSASAAGAPGSVTFRLQSTIGSSEQFNLAVNRANPDSINNSGNLFPYTAPTTPVTLPGAGSVDVSFPVYLPGNAFPGNLNAFSITAASVTDLTKGVSDARGHALASAADQDSVPTAFYPVGLVRQAFAQHPATGRDGPVSVPGRDLLLIASGKYGVSVVRDSALDQVGPMDQDANGLDDRHVGLIRPPSYSASIAVIPGFVNTAQEVLDLGLLAAGRGGLQLVDLRDLVDFPGQPWEDWHDFDGDGIDDRILRRLPIAGFVTDAGWFMSPAGRVIALVAAADTGSIPTSSAYNPALTVAGTGAGIVAIDVLAALDSLPGVPFVAGTLPTPGTVLDLELRGGPNPILAVADGNGGVAFYTVTAVGSPATVSFAHLGTVPLNGAWGVPYARDLAWIHDQSDSLYLAVGAGAAGLQVISVPPASAPFLAMAQRTEGPVIGVGTGRYGYVAAAMGSAGATLLKMPSLAELGQISPLAAPPYQAPVVLDLGASWTQGRPLRTGLHGTYTSSVLSLRFRPFTGGATAPDLLCADGSRTLALRAGPAGVLAVSDPGSPVWTPGVRLVVAPNPLRDRAEFRVLGEWSLAGAITPGSPAEFAILDLQGRLVRRLAARTDLGLDGLLARVSWDGRDSSGRPAAPGRYWVRASQRGGWSASSGFVMLR